MASSVVASLLLTLNNAMQLALASVQGFFRKGNILADMGRQREALVQYHRCLQLQADFFLAKDQIKNVRFYIPMFGNVSVVPAELTAFVQSQAQCVSKSLVSSEEFGRQHIVIAMSFSPRIIQS